MPAGWLADAAIAALDTLDDHRTYERRYAVPVEAGDVRGSRGGCQLAVRRVGQLELNRRTRLDRQHGLVLAAPQVVGLRHPLRSLDRHSSHLLVGLSCACHSDNIRDVSRLSSVL